MTAADRPSVTRDGMDPLTRAVSDTLDEYLSRHHGILTSHSNPEDFLTWLRENGYEVRPSVTDNARAEAWDEGYEAGRTDAEFPPATLKNPYRAAGRAETTSATDEDAARVVLSVLDDDERSNYIDTDALAPRIVAALADARLLATARPRPTREHALKKAYRDRQQPIQEDDAWAFGEGVRAGVDAVLALLNEKGD